MRNSRSSEEESAVNAGRLKQSMEFQGQLNDISWPFSFQIGFYSSLLITIVSFLEFGSPFSGWFRVIANAEKQSHLEH